MRAALETACSEAGSAARRQLTNDLNQIFRRLRHYESEDQWLGALSDGVAQHASTFGIFAYQNGTARLRAQRNLNAPEKLEFAVSKAGAFAAAVESREPVVTLCTAGEVGENLKKEQPSPCAHLFPLSNGGRLVAIVFAIEVKASTGRDAAPPNERGTSADLGADRESVVRASSSREFNGSALELITGMAAIVLERQANRNLHAQIGLMAKTSSFDDKATAETSKVSEVQRVLPAWADLDATQRSLHSKAQRFSRVMVAQMQLARPEAARAGREQNNFYMLFRVEIDKARETFRKQFMTIPSMVDYLHLELVQTAAQANEDKLGVDYPGQLV